jgi:hypothetical protein
VWRLSSKIRGVLSACVFEPGTQYRKIGLEFYLHVLMLDPSAQVPNLPDSSITPHWPVASCNPPRSPSTHTILNINTVPSQWLQCQVLGLFRDTKIKLLRFTPSFQDAPVASGRAVLIVMTLSLTHEGLSKNRQKRQNGRKSLLAIHLTWDW